MVLRFIVLTHLPVLKLDSKYVLTCNYPQPTSLGKIKIGKIETPILIS